MMNALKGVVHYSMCVQYGEGLELSPRYHVGSTYPVFILANYLGEPIQRWTGFSTAQRFVTQLKSSMSDLTSTNERVKRFEKSPSFRDALVLAKYHSDTRQYLKAIEYYEKVQTLVTGRRLDYSYQIFTNTANAVWSDSLSFDTLLNAANYVLQNRQNVNNIVQTIKILGRATRKKDRTEELGRYLRFGLEITANSKDNKLKSAHTEFAIDTILYVTRDTLAAIRAREFSMGTGWQNDPKRFYRYAAWCLERQINLAKAETYARTAADWAEPGAYKAMAYHQLASILDLRKKYDQAVRIMKLAVEEEPSHAYYAKELQRMKDNLENSLK
ncbi:MAG: hypothetical protein V3V99_12865 [candidate division Zixibacteria bacterium]